eukprot:6195702-Pleurochrysis_carterae.AAC.2
MQEDVILGTIHIYDNICNVETGILSSKKRSSIALLAAWHCDLTTETCTSIMNIELTLLVYLMVDAELIVNENSSICSPETLVASRSDTHSATCRACSLITRTAGTFASYRPARVVSRDTKLPAGAHRTTVHSVEPGSQPHVQQAQPKASCAAKGVHWVLTVTTATQVDGACSCAQRAPITDPSLDG